MLSTGLPGEEQKEQWGCYSDKKLRERFDLPFDLRNTGIEIGVIVAIDTKKRTADVRTKDRVFKDATWLLNQFNPTKGLGVDFVPAIESNKKGKLALVTVCQDRAFILGLLPEEVEEESDPSERDYSSGRDSDLRPNGWMAKTNKQHDTKIWAKATGQIVNKASEYTKMVLNGAKKTIKAVADTFEINTPGTNWFAQTDGITGFTNVQYYQKAHKYDITDFLQVQAGPVPEEGNMNPSLDINLVSTATAPLPNVNLETQASINATANQNINLESLFNINEEAFGNINMEAGITANLKGQTSVKISSPSLVSVSSQSLTKIESPTVNINGSLVTLGGTGGLPVARQTDQVQVIVPAGAFGATIKPSGDPGLPIPPSPTPVTGQIIQGSTTTTSV